MRLTAAADEFEHWYIYISNNDIYGIYHLVYIYIPLIYTLLDHLMDPILSNHRHASRQEIVIQRKDDVGIHRLLHQQLLLALARLVLAMVEDVWGGLLTR